MKKILSIVLLACVLLKPAPVKAVMSPLELALIGAVAGAGAYAKDFVEGIRQQLKTEKGRRAVLSWMRDCGASCWHVCVAPGFSEQFIPKADIESDMHHALVGGIEVLEKRALERTFNEDEEIVEYILPAIQERRAEESSALLGQDESVIDPIYYAAFIRREGREIPQTRLADWADNKKGFQEEAARDFHELGMKISDTTLRDWIHDGNIAEVLFDPKGVEIKDPVMVYALGGVSGGFRPSEMSAPLLLVTIRGKLPALNTGGHASLLKPGKEEASEDYVPRLERQAKQLKEFKKGHLPNILHPPKRATSQQPHHLDDDPLRVN
ncbi:MAG: hypothetical protein CMM87_02875 [Rickettsiales bacterium]|nr:hypothetical protein [Rickettsiales bacterium]